MQMLLTNVEQMVHHVEQKRERQDAYVELRSFGTQIRSHVKIVSLFNVLFLCCRLIHKPYYMNIPTLSPQKGEEKPTKQTNKQDVRKAEVSLAYLNDVSF